MFREEVYEPLPSKRECLNSRELAPIGNLTVMVLAERVGLSWGCAVWVNCLG